MLHRQGLEGRSTVSREQRVPGAKPASWFVKQQERQASENVQSGTEQLAGRFVKQRADCIQ